MPTTEQTINNPTVSVELVIADVENKRVCHSVTVFVNGLGVHTWSFGDDQEDAVNYYNEMIETLTRVNKDFIGEG
jgi:hypothetical protein